jgi:hypothetical protein
LLLAGSSKLLITPPLGTRMAGYRARTEGASQVHDDLFARCLAFESDGVRHALLALDVMGVGVEWVAELRRRVEQSADVAASHVLVSTTHTHSAQGGLFAFPGAVGGALGTMMGDGTAPSDPTGYEQLLRRAESAIRLAFSRLEPATLAHAEGRADGIAGNRVWFDRPADPSALVVAVLNAEQDPIGLLLHFNCHPTTLGEGDRGISGDFPGVAARIVEQSVGGTALFLNGALGDVSTRLTRRVQSYSEVVRFGRILGGEAVKALGRAEPAGGCEITASTTVVELAPQRRDWLERIERRVEALAAEGDGSHEVARQLHTAREGVQSAVRAAEAIAGLSAVPVELQQVTIGDAVSLVAVPGELFSGAQRALEAGAPGRRVRLVGPANGYMGYFPSAEAYDEGGYEVGVSLVDRGGAELLTRAAIDLLGRGD